MPDRADAAAAILAAFAFVATGIYAALVPDAFVSGVPSIETYLILTLPIFPYAAYWAFGIRHALAVHRYRRQALGIGFVVLAVWATVTIFVLVPSASVSVLAAFEQFLAFDFLFIVLFYWIDASVLTARRSDPLLRDTLYWGKIRVPLWIAVIVTTLIPLSLLGYIGITSNTALFNQLNANTLGGPVISLVLSVIANFSIVIPICGIIYLPAIAIRSRWDRSLRRHFVWFAPASVGLLLIFFGPLSGANSFVAQMITGLIFVIVGYSLYQSARALVPLNRVSLLATE